MPPAKALLARSIFLLAFVSYAGVSQVLSGSVAVVTTLAGSAAPGLANGQGTAARFNFPQGVAVSSAGSTFVVDTNNNVLRTVSASGLVSAFVGSVAGPADGQGTAAQFNTPDGVGVSASGIAYVADWNNRKIRAVSPSGLVSTLAGGSLGSANGQGTAASFNTLYGVAVAASGTIYVADKNNNMIRAATPGGAVTTLAGSTTAGYLDGQGSAARFNGPAGVAVSLVDGTVFVAEYTGNVIRAVSPAGAVTTFAGSPSAGFLDGLGTAAKFRAPNGVAVSLAGTVFVADTSNHVIRAISPWGLVTTIAGSTASGHADGVGVAARFYGPCSLSVSGSGSIVIADALNNMVRLLAFTPCEAGSYCPNASVAIPCPPGSTCNPATGAFLLSNCTLCSPSQTSTLSLSPSRSATRTATPLPSPPGAAVVTTLAGDFSVSSVVDGQGSAAAFTSPRGVAAALGGTLYVADRAAHVIRVITTSGTVSTFAGSSGVLGNVNGVGTLARLNVPTDVAVASSGVVFVADAGNCLIRAITPSGVVSTFAGTGGSSFADGQGTNAAFSFATAIAVSLSSDVIYVADTCVRNVRLRAQ